MDREAVETFKERAAGVETRVLEVPDLRAALDAALAIAAAAPPVVLLPTVPGGSPPAPGPKALAAPGLAPDDLAYLSGRALAAGVEVVSQGLRSRLAGLEAAFTVATLGLAETGTCVLEGETEDARLASMLCETHVVGLRKRDIVRGAAEGLAFLERALARENNVVSFISGASRTSDIERVLTLGVHGPLSLVALLIED